MKSVPTECSLNFENPDSFGGTYDIKVVNLWQEGSVGCVY